MSVSVVAVTEQTSSTFTLPAGVADGDFLVLYAGVTGSGTFPTLPAGWTQLDISDGTHGPGALSAYRVASSEPASYTVTSANCGWVALVRGQDSTTPVNGHSLLRSLSVTSPPSTGFTTTVDGCLLMWCGISSTTTAAWTAPTGYTLQTSSGNDSDCLATKTQTTQGTTGTVTGGLTPSQNTQVALIAIAPGAPANTVAPAVTGSTTVGSTLTTDNGTWTGSPTSYSYQWKSAGSNVGSNQNTYVTQAGDVGKAVGCTVTATNAGGSTPQASNTITVTGASLSTVAGKTGTSGSAVMQKAKSGWTYITGKTGTSGTAVDQKGAGSYTKIKGH